MGRPRPHPLAPTTVQRYATAADEAQQAETEDEMTKRPKMTEDQLNALESDLIADGMSPWEIDRIMCEAAGTTDIHMMETGYIKDIEERYEESDEFLMSDTHELQELGWYNGPFPPEKIKMTSRKW